MADKRSKKASGLLRDAGLRTKMVLIFFVLLLVPFSFFTYYVTRRISAVTQEQTFSAARKTFDETATAVRTRIEKVTNVITLLTYDDLIYHMASTDPQDYPYILQLEDTRTLSTSFSHLEHLSEVSGIRLYVKNDYLYSTENRYIFPLGAAGGARWYQLLAQARANQWYTPLDFADQPSGEQKLFSCMRMIYDPSALKSPLGVLRVDLKQSVMEQAISRSAVTENGAVLLLSGGRIVLSSSNLKSGGLPAGFQSVLEQLAPDEWGTVEAGGKNYYVYCTRLSPTDWQLVTAIPYSDIYSVSRELRNEMILVMLVLAGVAYAIAIFLSDHTLRRVWQLSAAMQKVEAGDVNAQFASAGRDEIGQLIAHFNRMMRHIRQLMDEKVQYGLEIKNLELKALQAQINPHFLYNTLDTINCLALQNGAAEITEVVSALATFYKISLSKGRDQIPIREEVLHAQMYLKIQNRRFEGRMNAVWQIDPAIESLLTIKIVLQPIIENAAIHGIFEKEDSTGTVTVRGWREGNDVYITVTDDGVGMTPEAVVQNFSPLAGGGITQAPGGYGVHNINDRLRIAYGPEYGLSCQSTPGAGTTVTIHIPAVPQAGLSEEALK